MDKKDDIWNFNSLRTTVKQSSTFKMLDRLAIKNQARNLSSSSQQLTLFLGQAIKRPTSRKILVSNVYSAVGTLHQQPAILKIVKREYPSYKEKEYASKG